jgi:hypothetical protein
LALSNNVSISHLLGGNAGLPNIPQSLDTEEAESFGKRVGPVFDCSIRCDQRYASRRRREEGALLGFIAAAQKPPDVDR